MKTYHKIFFSHSSEMKEIDPQSVNLVVTSPPYPMIEMWDKQFSEINPKIRDALTENNGPVAYDLMHEELKKTWNEIDRVIAPDGIVCINIGDATRKIGEEFQLYPNHARIISHFEEKNYRVLPMILWRKETNKPNKFMGSGMLPPNAYVTLEHEYILIFRKGKCREFPSDDRRQESAYFWEERNVWFSDIWNGLKGTLQDLDQNNLRERSGAYPFELAYRLINMYSIQDDLVLDPFLGTGTTTIAAICSARNSIGYEIDQNFNDLIKNRMNHVRDYCNNIMNERLNNHMDFVIKRESEKEDLKHHSEKNSFKVMTGQERKILFRKIEDIKRVSDTIYETSYTDMIPTGSSSQRIIRPKQQKLKL
jgi:DNA modification methylase